MKRAIQIHYRAADWFAVCNWRWRHAVVSCAAKLEEAEERDKPDRLEVVGQAIAPVSIFKSITHFLEFLITSGNNPPKPQSKLETGATPVLHRKPLHQ